MSSYSPDVSEASTKVSSDSDSPKSPKKISKKSITHLAQSTNPTDVLLFLFAFRLLNALTVRTFFQPDEYFQSLEPAWALAFGEGSGAWITWVCLEQMSG
jgi:GPI mannosyltransferase 3